MLSILFYGFQNILDLGIYLEKKIYYYMLISATVIIINVILNYILLPKFGYIVAAYTTLFSYLISTSLIFWISIQFYKIKIDWKRFLIPLFLLCVTYYIFNYMITKSLLISVITFVFYLFLIKTYWFNNDEKTDLTIFFKQLIK